MMEQSPEHPNLTKVSQPDPHPPVGEKPELTSCCGAEVKTTRNGIEVHTECSCCGKVNPAIMTGKYSQSQKWFELKIKDVEEPDQFTAFPQPTPSSDELNKAIEKVRAWFYNVPLAIHPASYELEKIIESALKLSQSQTDYEKLADDTQKINSACDSMVVQIARLEKQLSESHQENAQLRAERDNLRKRVIPKDSCPPQCECDGCQLTKLRAEVAHNEACAEAEIKQSISGDGTQKQFISVVEMQIAGLRKELLELRDSKAQLSREITEAKRDADNCRQIITTYVEEVEAKDKEIAELRADRANIASLMNTWMCWYEEHVFEFEQEAKKHKSNGDMYGWNFHEGKKSGLIAADIELHNLKKAISASEKEGKG